MAVPPHLLKNISQSSEVSERQRAAAQKGHDDALRLATARLESSQRISCPNVVLERLLNDKSITCPDQVREQAEQILEKRKEGGRWPSPSDAKVPRTLYIALKEHPQLWEGVEVKDIPTSGG